jgi:hypothetical protein
MSTSRIISVLAFALFASVAGAPANALTLTPACEGDCFGVDIEVEVTLTSVQLTMDFEDYVGTETFPPGHPELEAIAFKLFTNDDVNWEFVSGSLDSDPFTGFDSFVNGGLANGGCTGSGNGWDCFLGNLDIVAEGNPILTLNYAISNADALLGAGASSFKAEFGSATDNGWLISEKMIPEPSGAAMFLVGGVVMGSAIRRRRG